jgi:hypothetical protein
MPSGKASWNSLSAASRTARNMSSQVRASSDRCLSTSVKQLVKIDDLVSGFTAEGVSFCDEVISTSPRAWKKRDRRIGALCSPGGGMPTPCGSGGSGV